MSKMKTLNDGFLCVVLFRNQQEWFAAPFLFQLCAFVAWTLTTFRRLISIRKMIFFIHQAELSRWFPYCKRSFAAGCHERLLFNELTFKIAWGWITIIVYFCSPSTYQSILLSDERVWKLPIPRFKRICPNFMNVIEFLE